MTEEQHSAIQNRYYIIVKKLEELETQIKSAKNEKEASALRSDFRDLVNERETIMNDLIEVKP